VGLDGDDTRRDPLVVRKATLASLLSRSAPGLRFNEYINEMARPLVSARGLQARARRHRVEAAQLGLPLGAIAGLDRVEEPGGAGAVKREDGLD